MKLTTHMPTRLLKSLQKPSLEDRFPAGADSQLDVILNGIYDHAIVFLNLDGNITSWNAGAQKLQGFTAAQILGRNFSCFYLPEDIASQVPQQVLTAARDNGRFETQGWRLRENGERFWADVAIHSVRDSSGKVAGFVRIARDITLQHQLALLKEELNQSRKQELIGQLTGGVAHDFNNLMTVIEAGHQLVAKYSEDSRISRVLEVSKIAIDKNRKLIAQLMAFSRQQILKPAATNINATISVFDALIEKAVGGIHRVEWKLAPDLPQAYTDSAQLQSALLNLIVNARDAMTGGGAQSRFSPNCNA